MENDKSSQSANDSNEKGGLKMTMKQAMTENQLKEDVKWIKEKELEKKTISSVHIINLLMCKKNTLNRICIF